MSFITQKGATGPLAVQASGTFQTSTDGNLGSLVGTRYDLSDGREVIFVSTGTAVIGTAGMLCQDQGLVSNHQGLTVTAVQAYSNNGNTPATVTVTLGATALTANMYSGGFLTVDSGPGIGQILRIASNPTALASATGVVITLEDGPNQALTTSSVVSLAPAHGSSVVMNPTTATNAPIGIALNSIAANSFGFLISKGFVNALGDANIGGVGTPIVPSVLTVGAVSLGGGTLATLGYMAKAGASATTKLAFVNL